MSLEVPRGAVRRAARPQRRRQVDAVSPSSPASTTTSAGEIRIRGHDVRRQPSAALQRLGVVFQSRTLDIDLTLHAEPAYHAALHGIRWASEARERTEALEIVGLADRADEKVRALSGGQARRVEIARSLMHEPALLLLDEATVGLDLGSRESVINIVRELVDERAARRAVGDASNRRGRRPAMPSSSCTRAACCSAAACRTACRRPGTTTVREAFRAITGTAHDGEGRMSVDTHGRRRRSRLCAG